MGDAPRAMDIDESRWPLVVHTYDGEQTDDDLAYYLRRLDAVLGRGKPFATLTFIRRFAPHVSHVSRLASWTNANHEAHARLCKASAIVVPSAAARFMLSSFYLLSSLDYPHIVTDDPRHAERWLAGQMTAANLAVATPAEPKPRV